MNKELEAKMEAEIASTDSMYAIPGIVLEYRREMEKQWLESELATASQMSQTADYLFNAPPYSSVRAK